MSLQLDIHSLLYLFIFGNLFISLMITFYRFHFPRDRASVVFIAAKWIQVVFWCSILLWDRLPRYLAIPLSNGLILAGGTLEIAALLLMMNMLGPKDKRYYLTLILISIVCFITVALFWNRPNNRVAVTSLFAALFAVHPGYRLSVNALGSPLQKLLGYVFFGFAGAMLWRGAYALFLAPDMGALTANTAQYVYYMGMFFLLIVGTAAFILLSNEHSYEALKRMATYDSLTGIMSRRTFFQEAEQKLELAAKRHEPCTLLILDLDHFKKVNDTYGHDKGDTVLQHFAMAVEQSLGEGDLFGRIGGEEFGVLLYGMAEAEGFAKAQQLCALVEEASLQVIPDGCTVSVGAISVLPDSFTALDTLYKLGDQALYQAKTQGRNRAVIAR